MLKSLYPGINWDEIEAVGFDMDGTLYDEFDFIRQVYRPIAALLAPDDTESVYRQMLHRWLEKGSSYNRIFDEVLQARGVEEGERGTLIAECLRLFRGYEPQLELSGRVSVLLDLFAQRYGLFLLTDGQSGLQWAKFRALGLGRWFDAENVGVSGDHGAGFHKPNPAILSKLALTSRGIAPQRVVFFGDRAMDEELAKNAGYHFVLVKGMQRRKQGAQEA
ncbi:hypothetical protein CBW65_04545 [Tumebacillus avium]|uniref:Haloacid dehalogenase n=1 Tax=Tumebacillus avium TaxID=1903704 RepID=A0A1Y0IKR3_9BACL|nr:HAD family hydrolase [Tumebacillus avium]ARU60416.1 hypothetical protein CBW65_04545 [Tumebacillus avium]